VEPGAMLFPAIFFEPTNKEVLQLELGRTKVRAVLRYLRTRKGPLRHEVVCLFVCSSVCLSPLA